ncbi:MAG: BrnT family toxin [Cyanobacterium sp. T60_A2020_053]|nr:BrnT family toxin [Cyanobacterium sp. T60_A2020_053]
MKFEWDENKRQTNISKHGIDFIDAQKIFDYDTVTIEDDRFNYGEQRFIAIGLLNGKTIVVVYTEISNKIRIISARKATKNEQQIYFNEIYD